MRSLLLIALCAPAWPAPKSAVPKIELTVLFSRFENTMAAPTAGPSQLALGTPGVYSERFHLDRTNPRIRADIEAGRFARLQFAGGKLQIAETGSALSDSLSAKIRRIAAALEGLRTEDGAQLVLVEAAPDSPESRHPKLLVVTKDDYQLTHAGVRRNARYMTADLFAEAGLIAADSRRFGAAQLEALESLSAVLGTEFAAGRAPAAEPSAPTNPLVRFWRWLRAPSEAPRVPWLFAPINGKAWFHGTTLDDLIRIVESGGVMKPDISQYSMLWRDSVEYGYRRQSDLRRPARENPMVLLQFPLQAISDKVSGESFRPAAMLMEFGGTPNHQSYAIATAPIPLSLMSDESKRSIILWLRVQAARYPEQRRWAELLPKFQSALAF